MKKHSTQSRPPGLRRLACVIAVSIMVPGTMAGTLLLAGPARASTAARPSVTVRATWPQFRDHPTHSGDNTTENLLSASTVPYMAMHWHHTTGNNVSSSPAVAGGLVYVGSSDGTVYALKAATGTKKWAYATGGVVASSPAVAGGTVYVGSDDGNVYALNATTGAVDWTYATGSAVASSPTVAGGTVYAGSDDGNVYALNATTGAVEWSYSTGSVVTSSPAVAGGVVYIGTSGGYDSDMYALNATTGAVDWISFIGLGISSSPAVAGGLVYFGAGDGNVYALNATTGAVDWLYTTGGPVDSSPAVAGRTVYIGSYDGNVYALNATTGTKQWAYTTGGAVESSPAVANGIIYAGSDDGSVYALNATTGSEEWSYSTGGMVYSSPAVANGTVYVGSDNHNVYAFGVRPNTPSIAASPSASQAVVGTTITDMATLSGGASPTGTIEFKLYGPAAAGCTGTPVDDETVTVTGDGSYTTPTGYAPAPGSYQWTASYSGDTSNNPAVTACGDQPVTITTAAPALANTPNPASGITGATALFKDTATLSGGYNPTGTIEFTFTDPTGAVLDDETVTVTGDGTYVTPTGYTFAPLVAGTYQWTASYSGDSSNNSATAQAPVTITEHCGCPR